MVDSRLFYMSCEMRLCKRSSSAADDLTWQEAAGAHLAALRGSIATSLRVGPGKAFEAVWIAGVARAKVVAAASISWE